jgi:hypothetical protein
MIQKKKDVPSVHTNVLMVFFLTFVSEGAFFAHLGVLRLPPTAFGGGGYLNSFPLLPPGNQKGTVIATVPSKKRDTQGERLYIIIINYRLLGLY